MAKQRDHPCALGLAYKNGELGVRINKEKDGFPEAAADILGPENAKDFGHTTFEVSGVPPWLKAEKVVSLLKEKICWESSLISERAAWGKRTLTVRAPSAPPAECVLLSEGGKLFIRRRASFSTRIQQREEHKIAAKEESEWRTAGSRAKVKLFSRPNRNVHACPPNGYPPCVSVTRPDHAPDGDTMEVEDAQPAPAQPPKWMQEVKEMVQSMMLEVTTKLAGLGDEMTLMKQKIESDDYGRDRSKRPKH